MKRLIQLAPRLSGVGAALFAGSALAAQMYLNPLAGNTAVDKGIYGAVEADAEAGIEAYAGLTLPAPIAASYVTSRSNIPTTSPGISDAFTDIIKKVGENTDTATHTVAGWFKIDSLPSAGNYQMLWAAVSHTGGDGAHGGYRVCVNPAGEIAIGKINGSTYAFANGSTGEPLLTSGAAISAGTWFHLAVAIAKTDGARTATPTVFVNGKLVPQATTGTFATNLNGNRCESLVMGMNISAAGFYVDTEAITKAATVQALAVDPTKQIYAAQWTRNVPAGGAWHPTGADSYPWSATGMTLTSTNPLVYRGSVTLNVTATSDSTLTLNASPSLTVLTTDYGSNGTGTLTIASGSNTLTAATTTISAKTVLDGTGFSLGNLSIAATGTLSVDANRNFTVASIAEGGKLIITPTATEIANGRISLTVGESVTLSTTNVEVTGYGTFTATGGTITLPIPTWTPTAGDTSWANNWSATPSDGGTAILDLSHLTAAQTVAIPASVNLGTTSIIGASESVPVTIESGARLGTLTVQGKATLPAAIPATSVSLETGAVLSLTGEGTLPAISGSGTVTLTANATVTLGSADALASTLTITGEATSTIKGGAFVPSCDLTNAGWTGTFEFASISGTAANGMDWRKLGNSGSKVVIPNGVTVEGYFNAQSWTLNAPVALDGAINITNGTSTNSYTFTGALTGSGTFTLSGSNGATIAVLLRNADGFTGTLTIASESTMNKAFIVGGTRTFNSNADKGKIIIAGAVNTNAVRTWTAKNEISVEGTLTTSLSEEEATNGYTLSGVRVASGGKVRFVRPDKWVVEETSNVYDPDTAVFADATWTGGGSDTNWATAANWSCNGQAVTAAPGTSLASLTVEAGKTITLPGAVTVGNLTTSGAFTLAGAADTLLTAKAVTLGGAVTLNAPLVLDLASALTTDKAITVNASGALTTKGTVSLTNAGCAFSGPLTVESGSLTWQHNGDDKTISGAVTVKEDATFATVANQKYFEKITGALSGAGVIRVKVPSEANRVDGARFLYIEGKCTDFTGSIELEISTTGVSSNSETMPKRTSVVIKPSDNVFNGSIDVVEVSINSSTPPTTATPANLWPYSKIFFANTCTFAGTIGGQGTVLIGRTGDRDNPVTLAQIGTASVGTVTLTNQLATYAGSVAIPDSGSTLLIQPTEAVTFAGKLSGEGKLDVETAQAVTLTGDLSGFTGSLKLIEGSSLTLDTASTMALSGQLNGYGALTLGGSHGTPTVALSGANGDYHGVVTVASGATLTNAGSTASVPFGKGKIVNDGTVKLMGKTGDWGSGQLPPTSGSGKITFCAGSTSRIPGEITTTGTITFEGTTEEAAAAVVTFIKNATDFSGKVASISGASVVVGEGVTLAKDVASSPLITIAANRSLSGTGTINVPVTFENDNKATMASNASLTFGSTLTVPKDVTLPGTIKLASTAVISGTGILSGAVNFAEGATIDATASTVEQMLKFTGTPTFAATIPVKVRGICKLFSVPSTVSLTDEQVRLTWAESEIAGSKVMIVEVASSIKVAQLFVPPTIPEASAENPRDAGVDEAITKAAETYAGYGMVISEVTAITATGTDGKSTRDVNAAALFDGVLSFTQEGEAKANGTIAATATISYDFGVADMTIKSLQLEDDDAAKLYVLLAAKVQNSVSSNTASFAEGTKLTVLNGETELTPKSVTATVATGVANAAETKGVQWLAVPLATLFSDSAPTGTRSLKVKASKTAN